jgi:hypothetical protein
MVSDLRNGCAPRRTAVPKIMKDYALVTLERILAIARRNGADELRLISGRYPMMVVKNMNKFIDGPELPATMIRDIHHVCLALAASEIPTSEATFAYRFVSPTLGTVSCMYTLRGGKKSLSLFPEGGVSEEVESAGRGKPPTLSAEAQPEGNNGDRDKGNRRDA